MAEAVSISAAARTGGAPEAERDPVGGTRVTSPCDLPVLTDTVLVAVPCQLRAAQAGNQPRFLSHKMPRGTAQGEQLHASSTDVSGHLFTPELAGFAVEQIEVRMLRA